MDHLFDIASRGLVEMIILIAFAMIAQNKVICLKNKIPFLLTGETDVEVRLNALRLVQSLLLDEGNFGVVQELNEVVTYK